MIKYIAYGHWDGFKVGGIDIERETDKTYVLRARAECVGWNKIVRKAMIDERARDTFEEARRDAHKMAIEAREKAEKKLQTACDEIVKVNLMRESDVEWN